MQILDGINSQSSSESTLSVDIDILGGLTGGGALAELNIKNMQKMKSKSKGSSIKSGGVINIAGDSILVRGSEISGDASVALDAKKGDVTILDGTDTESSAVSQQTASLDIFKALSGGPLAEIKGTTHKNRKITSAGSKINLKEV